jgi:hypothetical protein
MATQPPFVPSMPATRICLTLRLSDGSVDTRSVCGSTPRLAAERLHAADQRPPQLAALEQLLAEEALFRVETVDPDGRRQYRNRS